MAWQDITDRESVVKAIRECKRRGREPFLKLYGYRRAREYYLVHEGRAYDSKAILGVAHKYQFGKALKYSDFSGGDKTVKPKLESLGFEVNVGGPSFSTERNDSLARAERDRRMRLWHDLPGNGVPKRVTPALLRDMGLYGGASGIWVAKQLTASITDDGFGVSVGLLHTGSAYADDLTESGILYHYPKTGRPPGRDSSEIQATKNARHLNIPVFVIAYPSLNSTNRDVYLGWIEEWDDLSRIFLIGFGEDQPEALAEEPDEETPFDPFGARKRKKGEVERRTGQQKFRFQVLRRYGPKCMACNVDVVQLLDAAHIVPERIGGSADPRNGLALCGTHHKAFDRKLIAIHPETFKIDSPKQPGQTRNMGVSEGYLRSHTGKFPHKDALMWLHRR